MSTQSLTVVYGTRRFKTPVNPGTLLGQVRDQICSSKELNLKASEYTLSRQGKPLDLTLPFRFSNLVNNAQLDLVKAAQNPAEGSQNPVRIKIRIPGKKDFVSSYSADTQISSILADAKLNGELRLAHAVVSPSSTLASLGGSSGGLLFNFNESSLPKSSTKPAPKPFSKASAQSAQPAQPAQKPSLDFTQAQKEAAHQQFRSPPSSPKPSSNQESNGFASNSNSNSDSTGSPRGRANPINVQKVFPGEEDPNNLGSQQFLTYYKHIKTQAEPPLLSKSTADRLKAEKQSKIDSTTIRIRFPDQTLLEGKFANGERGKDVYDFVRSYLREVHDFELLSVKPDFVVAPEAHLINDCHFGSRSLLYFIWKDDVKVKGHILTDKALALMNNNAEQIKDVKASSQNKSKLKTTAASGGGADDTSKLNKSENTGSEGGKLKSKIPKWLKLHK